LGMIWSVSMLGSGSGTAVEVSLLIGSMKTPDLYVQQNPAIMRVCELNM
jgi:hypothetical protein